MSHAGFDALCARSLIDVLWNRRTHRVSRGASVAAGAMSYTPAAVDPHPLDELEEALLIASTGCTGLTMPDRPFQDASGDFIMAKPNLTMDGRTAGGPDNAQGTHFFLINDTGTYFLKKMPPLPPAELTPETLIARAAQAKVKVLDRRLDVPDSAGRVPGVPRLEPHLVEPAGHHGPVPRGGPVAPVHQRADVHPHAARRGAADARR